MNAERRMGMPTKGTIQLHWKIHGGRTKGRDGGVLRAIWRRVTQRSAPVLRVEQRVVIQRAVTDVFTYMVDFQHEPEWNPLVLEAMQTSVGPVQVGTTFHDVSRFLGRRVESNYEVTRYDPGEHIAIRSTSGPLSFTLQYTFAPVRGGTELVGMAEVEPRGMLRLAQPLVVQTVRHQLAEGLQRIQRRLEAY
jgi:uncharacterized membrane protein